MSTFLSIFLFLASAGLAVHIALHPHRKKNLPNPFYVFVIGVFISEVILFFPFCYEGLNGNLLSFLSTLLASIHTSLRLFLVDCDFEIIVNLSVGLTSFVKAFFIPWGLFLFVLSPVLTAGAALSFLANVSAHTKYFFGFRKDAYIFSELNEFSIALGKSLKNNDPTRMIVYTDVYEKAEEQSTELIKDAKKIDAVIFKNDITTINFRIHSKKKKLYFFVIGKDEDENLNQTAALASPYHPNFCKQDKKDISKLSYGYDYKRGDTRLYLFTASFANELQVKALRPKYIRVRRIIERQSLIYKLLNDHGMQIFESAKETGNTVFNRVTKQNDPEKKISAMVVGLGSYGTEMLRALSWFGQMHPYRLEITAFEADKNATEKFRAGYPELFDFDPNNEEEVIEVQKGKKVHNGDFETPGESHYKITINAGVNVNSYTFDKTVSAMSDITYIFVSLGDDNMNIKTATKLRMLFRREGLEPVIHTIVYNHTNQTMLATDYARGQNEQDRKKCLCILPFGAISSSYTEDCILNSEIEKLALERHMKYTHKQIAENGYEGKEKEEKLKEGEESFWGVDYNYRSSIASAIHGKYKHALNISGIKKAPADRTEDEQYFCANMEHQRWNAYVRSEGFVKTAEGAKRDNLIKTHHLLVPFDELPRSEQIKDDD